MQEISEFSNFENETRRATLHTLGVSGNARACERAVEKQRIQFGCMGKFTASKSPASAHLSNVD
jgi:hypothetical protein